MRVTEPRGLRVLLLNYEYPPLGGGAGVATAALARRLAERGAAVDVVTAAAARYDRRAGSRRGLGHEEPVERLKLFRVPTWRKGLHQSGMLGAGSYLVSAFPVVRRLTAIRRYHIVHAFFSLPTGLLLPLARRCNARTIVSLRGSDVPGYDRFNPRLERMHRLLGSLTRRVWRTADRVVTVCGALGELARRTVPDLAYTVARNGVDLDLFQPGSRTPGTDRIRCVAVARLVERKGLADLLHAWSQLERGRFELEIIGRGECAAELTQLSTKLGLGTEVRFAGALTHDALAERYRAADLFTLAPHDEAFGNVFAEALASGLPIVGSNVGGIPELVRDGEHGLLVPPGQPALLAGAIRRLADDPSRRRAMAAENRRHAEATLSWHRATERYLEIYHDALGIAPSSRAASSSAPVAL